MINDQRPVKPVKSSSQIINARSGPVIIHIPRDDGSIGLLTLAPGSNTPLTLAQRELAGNPNKRAGDLAASRMTENMKEGAAAIKKAHEQYLARDAGTGHAIIELK